MRHAGDRAGGQLRALRARLGIYNQQAEELEMKIKTKVRGGRDCGSGSGLPTGGGGGGGGGGTGYPTQIV